MFFLLQVINSDLFEGCWKESDGRKKLLNCVLLLFIIVNYKGGGAGAQNRCFKCFFIITFWTPEHCAGRKFGQWQWWEETHDDDDDDHPNDNDGFKNVYLFQGLEIEIFVIGGQKQKQIFMINSDKNDHVVKYE